MRNFWLEGNVDGRETLVAGGPIGKKGGMTVSIRMRDEGVSVEALKVVCYEDEGFLNVFVYDENGHSVYGKSTKR